MMAPTIWVQIDNCDTEKVRLESEMDIDDLKKKLLGKDANKYRAIYQNVRLRSDTLIPGDTTFEQPVLLQLQIASDLTSTQSQPLITNVDGTFQPHFENQMLGQSTHAHQRRGQPQAYDPYYSSINQGLLNTSYPPVPDYSTGRTSIPFSLSSGTYSSGLNSHYNCDQTYHSFAAPSNYETSYYSPTGMSMPTMMRPSFVPPHEIEYFRRLGPELFDRTYGYLRQQKIRQRTDKTLDNAQMRHDLHQVTRDPQSCELLDQLVFFELNN
ncbi:unnamed protein product [Adineta ricciae]|uniref:Ubiquitin-like domain-containing protein n=1 Tax=Adineta ricciae TaxID=249248 RepID=A0A814MUS5_ADIRI|nr:unnamed protein product [Adineta ricciae]